MFDTFLKLDGIEGESTDHVHKGEIELLSFNWGVDLPTVKTASSAGAISGEKADIRLFTCRKLFDKATPSLLFHAVSGKHIKSAKVSLRRATEKPQEFIVYSFTDVLVAKVHQVGAGSAAEPVPVEDVSFAFCKFHVEYRIFGKDGMMKGSTAAGWDLKMGVKV
jgi:type VI secretion system secreted protein Hcp